jgi:uncharacterized membrane protein YkvA (DUF1232 family)
VSDYIDSEPDDRPVGVSTGLLSFYDRLRDRVVEAAEGRRGKLGAQAAEALLLAPDVLVLLVRLSLDREVPKSTRTLLAGAIAYFLLPADLFPELVLGGVGFADDLLLATGILAQSLGPEMEPFVRRHWSGRESLPAVIGDVSRSAEVFLSEGVRSRLDRVLARWGVELDEPLSRS